jgi:hypothetical protein
VADAPAYRAAAFGLRWLSDVPLMHFQPIVPEAEGGAPDIQVARATALAPRESRAQVRRGHVYADGTRFPWEREAMFDTYAGNRVDYVPGPDWTGALPSAFYGTVAAHLLAWRGLLPLHACAVEVGGKAVLIAGTGGAGKSSLMAGLLGLGAPLVSDDLTAVTIRGGVAEVLPGRTTIRLGPEVVQWTEGEPCEPPSPATRGKHVIRPALRTRAERLPLAGMISLGAAPGAVPALARGSAFAAHLFRPAWLAALPGHRERQQGLLALASVPVIGFPAVERTGRDAHLDRARTALALAGTLAGL